MRITARLLESDADITRSIMQAVRGHLDKSISKSIPRIVSDIKQAVKESLIQEPEYSSLTSGTLKIEFGIPDASQVSEVVDALVNTIQFTQNKIIAGNRSLSGGFTLNMMKSDDMSGVIFSDAAVVTTDKGTTLPWLEWLLLKGNTPIVKKYDVKYISSSRSRSGLGVMIPSNRDWRVPPLYIGKEESNWTTRAIDKVESKIYTIIKKRIEESL